MEVKDQRPNRHTVKLPVRLISVELHKSAVLISEVKFLINGAGEISDLVTFPSLANVGTPVLWYLTTMPICTYMFLRTLNNPPPPPPYVQKSNTIRIVKYVVDVIILNDIFEYTTRLEAKLDFQITNCECYEVVVLSTRLCIIAIF